MKALILRRLGWGEIAVLVTVIAVAIAYVAQGGAMFSPGSLNADNRGNTELGGVRSHAQIAGKCAACHTPAWSSETMADRCMDCHTDIRSQITGRRPLHGTLSAGMECRSCHTEHQGAHAALTSFARFNHDYTAFKLTGAHRAVECQSCHEGNLYKGTQQACIACHAEPQVHLGKFGSDCASCHSTTTWAGVTLASASLSSFDHDRTGFKLTGKHKTTDCKSCHVNNVFKGTAKACVSCHAEPTVHLGKFGTSCGLCHSTSTWAGVTLTTASLSHFDHDCTGFKLTGKHKTTDCKSCHVNNVFKGTAKTCVACHAEPTVHLGRFGTSCSFCHSTTTWAGATLTTANLTNFDHDRTGFKLTGKHKGVDCKDCHVNNVFKGTSQACVSCHAEPLVPTVHKFRYGSGCVNCHTTTAWQGSTFTHAIFSINHGKRNNTCATCHQDAKTFAVYTCYNCHEHTPAKEERRHARRNIVKLDNCIECHGRKARRQLGRADGPDLSLCLGCTEAGVHRTEANGFLLPAFVKNELLRGAIAVPRLGTERPETLLGHMPPAPQRSPLFNQEFPGFPWLERLTLVRRSGAMDR
jgi:hypothetical protein